MDALVDTIHSNLAGRLPGPSNSTSRPLAAAGEEEPPHPDELVDHRALTSACELLCETFTRLGVTIVLGSITALAFTFGFSNV